MKKLLLIVLLAVVASEVLSDRDDRLPSNTSRLYSLIAGDSHETDPGTGRPVGVVRPQAEPSHRGNIVTWRDGDGSSDAPEPPAPPKPKRRSRGKSAPALVSTPAPASKEAPAWFPKSEWEEDELSKPDASGIRILLGRLSVSDDRAKLDLRKTLNHEIADWLAADVPMTWTPPQKLINRMIQGTHVQTLARSFQPKPGEIAPEPTPASAPEVLPPIDEIYTLYRAGQKLDFSDARRSSFIESYHREIASARMRRLGAIGAVVLASLAMISVYIRTDEATKGYYTNRLRVLAAAGLGAAGVVAYRYWT